MLPRRRPSTDTAELAPASHARAEEDIRAATTGKHGLLTRSIELDADALVRPRDRR